MRDFFPAFALQAPRRASRLALLAGAAILINCSMTPIQAETLIVHTVDAVTRKPIPARVSVRPRGGEWIPGRDAAGKPMLQRGLPRLWSSGTVSAVVPPGVTEVVASRPFAWLPASAELTVAPGSDSVSLTLELKALVDLPALGWYGGDAHDHVVHGEREYTVDLRAVIPIARAEGLDWSVFDEVWAAGPQPSPAERTAICKELTDDGFLAAWAQEHPKDHLGHMACFPLGTDREITAAVGENPYEPSLEKRERYTHFEIVRSLQALGTLTVYTHPAREYGGTPESPANVGRELPFDAVAAPWALEALDILTDAPDNADSLKLWFFLLDRGHRLSACGFTDTCYDRKGEGPGDTRTYVSLGGGGLEAGPGRRLPGDSPSSSPRTMASIIDAIRRGRTFATTGPLVLFTVDGEPSGTAFRADGRARKARIRAWNAVDYLDPRQPAFVTKILLVRNSVVVGEKEVTGEKHEAEWSVDIEGKETAWYVVEVKGSSARQFAVTSPFYFTDECYRPPRAAEALVRGKVTSDSGAPLEGKVLAVEFGLNHLKIVGEAKVEKGTYEIRCPAASRIRVEVDGFEPAMKSIFLDFDPIYRELFLPLHRDKLWDSAFYREIEARLGRVALDFSMRRRAD